MARRSLSFGISIPIVAAGFDTLVFWPIELSPEQVELFAGEVVPLLRPSP